MTDWNWKQHFEGYAAASLAGDAEQLAGFYATGFVAAAPSGAYGGLNDEKFREWLQQVHQFNQQSGMRGMAVVDAREECRVGPNHRLVTVRWGAQFEKSGERVIEFDISYVLQVNGPRPLIVAYISHEDQTEAMRREGV